MLLKRKELVERLAATGYTKKDAGIVIDDVFDMILKAMLDGNDVLIQGFGTFVIKEVSPKEVIDIVTKQRKVLPAYKTPKFVAGEKFKKSIKSHCRAEN